MKREPVGVTQDGEAKAVIQSDVSFEQAQDALALLKCLAIGNQDIDAGSTRSARAVVESLKLRKAKRC